MDKSRILVVDDEKTNIDVLVHSLMPTYQTLVAKSGRQALDKVRAFSVDLILLDIMMPEMDGFQVLERLKADQATRDIPVIFLTALDTIEDETRGIELGAADYIKKPFNPEVVRVRVRNQLDVLRARQELESQNRLLQENLELREQIESITRHDLKAPLNGIIGLPDLLLMDGDNLTAEQAEYIALIKESGHKMLDMINRSLDLYKMEKGTYQVTPKPMDLMQVIAGLRKEYAQTADAKGITLKVIGPEQDRAMVRAEDLLCFSLLSNLLTNALEASQKGDTVQIRVTELETEACVVVHNNQPVPEEIKECFFAKHVSQGKKYGTGLGTYSAKLMTENMHGRIEMVSSESQGTTVSVFLPGAGKGEE